MVLPLRATKQKFKRENWRRHSVDSDDYAFMIYLYPFLHIPKENKYLLILFIGKKNKISHPLVLNIKRIKSH